ncbi:hypothetical protein ILUMI_08730 [Ignelater luminosus]|uniref:Uncharacterized protein n=1 Tax=Ignelater luminosus TaxID=2038154 RepID=A0A8K0D1C5_IGNLU|nr:hypothetical protein ILUMI_08730 [Ignelater luminosus]
MITQFTLFIVLIISCVFVFSVTRCLPVNNNNVDLERITYSYNPITIKISNFNYSVPTAIIVIINSDYKNTSDEISLIFQNIQYSDFRGEVPLGPSGVIVTVPCNDGYVLVRGVCRKPYRK